MIDRAEIYENVTAQIAEFNKKGVALTDATSFAGDLEWDSLTVMDFVAAIEDEFDIIITRNRQAEIENAGQFGDALRDFYATTGAIVFSTGYMANLGMISTLAGKGEYVILDADSHASIYDGCQQGNAEIVRFRHNSVEDLDKRLGRLPPEPGKLVVLEGVYSMMGDIAPLKEMVAVCKKHGCMILVDEAHGM